MFRYYFFLQDTDSGTQTFGLNKIITVLMQCKPYKMIPYASPLTFHFKNIAECRHFASSVGSFHSSSPLLKIEIDSGSTAQLPEWCFKAKKEKFIPGL